MENQAALLLVLCTGVRIAQMRQERQRRKRRWQVRPINQRSLTTKTEFDYFMLMKQRDEEHFFLYTRMSPRLFEDLLALVAPALQKCHLRAISPEEKLAITLKYLAQGGTMQGVAFSYHRGASTVAQVINETCEAIWTVLSPLIATPNQEGWRQTADGFKMRWNLPLCLGAIDGKHINLRCPKNSFTRHFNYKKTFSIVLLGVANDQYEFSMVDIGAYGSQHDSGVFSASLFGKKLLDRNFQQLDMPEVGVLPGTQTRCHYFFVGDEAFPLQDFLMRPYPGRALSVKKKIFNYRLSRARRIIENTFGILAARWQIFRQTITAGVSTVEKVLLATTALHNYIMRNSDAARFRRYCPPNYVDKELPDGTIQRGDYRNDLANWELPSHHQWGSSNNATRRAIEMRDTLAEYFLSPEGSVPWQERAIS